MKVTAEDVAKAAGVSRSAVSRAFTEGTSLAISKRNHILTIASSMGYRPNLMARRLTTGGATGLVAVVTGPIDGPYEGWLLEALSREIRARGLWPLLVPVSPGQEADPALDHALAYQVDGAIIAAGMVSSALAARSVTMGAPLVMIGRVLSETPVDTVCCDNALGMQLLAEHMKTKGFRRIAWLGGRGDTFSNRERLLALEDALQGFGQQISDKRSGDYSTESGLLQGLDLLTQNPRPDAIICANDAMAIGVISAAQRLNLRIPEDIAVAGFDDIPAAAWEPLNLTTVANPVARTASIAVNLLSDRIAGRATAPVQLRLPPELRLRRSL